MRKILTIRVPLCAGGSIASGAATVGVLMEQIIALVARIFSLGVRFAPRSAGGSMLRANRRGAGEVRRPRRRQREDAGDDAGKREYQSGYGENKRRRPMPSPHRHGAEKCSDGDRH